MYLPIVSIITIKYAKSKGFESTIALPKTKNARKLNTSITDLVFLFFRIDMISLLHFVQPTTNYTGNINIIQTILDFFSTQFTTFYKVFLHISTKYHKNTKNIGIFIDSDEFLLTFFLCQYEQIMDVLPLL